MSLSQKHSGKILVPWFNTDEWRHVCKLTFSEHIDDQKKALEIIKIWKIRTPLLSAGVEGTMILLEALLINESHMTDEQVNQIYALALMRFLNICAANNDRQGTFHKTAVRHNLPKWLINIRHDIAHGHTLPSTSMLRVSLNDCLQWLKVKYWDEQTNIISDCVVEKQSENEMLSNVLSIYIRINVNLFQRIDVSQFEESLMENVNALIYKKFRMSDVDLNGVLSILEEMLKQCFQDEKNEKVGDSVADILVSRHGLLLIECEGDRIPEDFRDIWQPLINLLYDNRILFSVINKLFDATDDIRFTETIKETAAIWIVELFLSLINLEEVTRNNGISNGQKNNWKNCIKLSSKNVLCRDDAKIFERRILNIPTDYSSLYLEKVLIFNKNSETQIQKTTDFLNDTVNVVIPEDDENQIFTLSMLGLNENSFDSMDINEEQANEDIYFKKRRYVTSDLGGSKRWRIVKDTSVFKGCPLGILPHQKKTDPSPLVTYFF